MFKLIQITKSNDRVELASDLEWNQVLTLAPSIVASLAKISRASREHVTRAPQSPASVRAVVPLVMRSGRSE